jgi:hypothetical protein
LAGKKKKKKKKSVCKKSTKRLVHVRSPLAHRVTLSLAAVGK